MRYGYLKRTLDVTAAVILLTVLSPLIALIAAAVTFDVGWPVLFCQRRGGLRGQTFRIVKFRTMRDARGADGEPLSDAERLTGLGRVLRATSVDEIPELWNIMVGDMSFIGPRPFIADYLPLYTHEQARRHNVRPGLTGLAQVKGRNILSWEERFTYDLWYVDHMSFLLDLKIFLWTMLSVIRAHGITPIGEESMGRFLGSQRIAPVDIASAQGEGRSVKEGPGVTAGVNEKAADGGLHLAE
jgi:sugar transferase EpsL